jgi:regulator of protease activity HflC (stomatin/prohibitin superfamily)
VRKARNILRDTISGFYALQVFYERSTIEAAMRSDLTRRMTDEFNISIVSFQLLDISLPTKFQQALTDTEKLNLD